MIDPRTMKRSVNASILGGMLGTLFFMTLTAGPLALMLKQLGAGGVAIGSTATLIQLGMVAQVPGAFLSERLSRRKPLWMLLTLFARAIWVVPGILVLLAPEAAQQAVSTTIVVCAIYSLVAQMIAPSWFSWMADLVAEGDLGNFWSTRQGYVMASFLFCVAFSGWFLDRFVAVPAQGFAWLLILSAIMGTVEIAVHARIHEPPGAPANRGLPVWIRLTRPLQSRDFRYFTFAMSLWMFGVGLFGPFTNIYLKESFDILYMHLSALQIAGMASGVAASFLAGRIVQRVGIRPFALAMLAAVPLFHLFWFFVTGGTVALPLAGEVPQPIVLLFASSLVAGGVYANIGVVQLNLLTALAPTEGRTMAMAVHWSVVGLVSAMGPVAGGLLKDWFAAHPVPLVLPGGVPCSYLHAILVLHALLTWAVTLPLFAKVAPREGEWPVDRTMLHVFIFNPLRAVREIYNINLALGSKAVKGLAGKLDPER